MLSSQALHFSSSDLLWPAGRLHVSSPTQVRLLARQGQFSNVRIGKSGPGPGVLAVLAGDAQVVAVIPVPGVLPACRLAVFVGSPARRLACRPASRPAVRLLVRLPDCSPTPAAFAADLAALAADLAARLAGLAARLPGLAALGGRRPGDLAAWLDHMCVCVYMYVYIYIYIYIYICI